MPFRTIFIVLCALLVCISCAGGEEDSDDDSSPDDDSADDDSGDDDVGDDDSGDDDQDIAGPDSVQVATEFAMKCDHEEFATISENLDLFVEYGLTLYLEVRTPHIGDPDLAELLGQAETLGVPVRIWPLLTSDEGTWGFEDNADRFIENALDVMDHVESVTGHVDWVVLNLEMGHPKIDLLWQYVDEGDWAALFNLIMGNRDPEAFEVNRAKFQGLVDDLHDRGYKVQVTTYPYILDDMEDGDPDIQDAANVTIDGIDWDAWAFTPYTSQYTGIVGLPIGPYMVYDYGLSAVDRFGLTADLAVGQVRVEGEEGYAEPAQLAADIAAAKAAGVRRIDIYHLEGILESEDPRAWLDTIYTPAAEPPEEFPVFAMRWILRFADDVLDVI